MGAYGEIEGLKSFTKTTLVCVFRIKVFFPYIVYNSIDYNPLALDFPFLFFFKLNVSFKIKL